MHRTKKPSARAATLSLLLVARAVGSEPLSTPLADNLAGLAQIEATLLASPLAETDTDRAEASMYLAKNLTHYLRSSVIYADPHQPQLVYMPGFGFPNPDNLYLGTPIDPKGSYRIWGRLGNVDRTIFGVYSPAALKGETGARDRMLGSELKTDAAGNFELFLSAEKMGENWLPLASDVESMTIYQIYSDWNTQRKGKLMIERLDLDAPEAPAPGLTSASLVSRVGGLDAKIASFLKIWTGVTRRYHGAIPDNSLLPPRRIQVTYLGGQFSTGHWRLKDDQALIIEFDEPAASYWGFSFYQAWGELIDIATRQASLNRSQAHKDSDGKYRLVVTANDPGVANWIDISAHPHGVFNWRVTIEEPPPTPSTKVVPFADLAKHLPADTKYVSPEERQAVLVARRRHMARRLSP